MKMRAFFMLILAIVVMAAVLFLFRYDITVNTPIVVKLDRWTGEAWVANSGVWMDIEHAPQK